jgi:hypothetical protein
MALAEMRLVRRAYRSPGTMVSPESEWKAFNENSGIKNHERNCVGCLFPSILSASEPRLIGWMNECHGAVRVFGELPRTMDGRSGNNTKTVARIRSCYTPVAGDDDEYSTNQR